MKKVLTVDNLGSLQRGGIGKTINRMFAEAMRDCDDRPSLKKTREVVIAVQFTPMPDDSARSVPHVLVNAKIKPNFPSHTPAQGEILAMRVAHGNSGFEAVLPDYQGELFEDELD